MSPLKQLTLVALTLSGLCLFATRARADIYRWDTGEVIPGTEGIEPGPGVQLDHRELEFAQLRQLDLTDSRLDFSNLTSAHLDSTFTNANLTGAIVRGASFHDTTSRGFTQAQLASTASYQAKDLRGIGLTGNDLTDWDFSGQDLTNVRFSNLPSNCDVYGWSPSTLTNANLSGAAVTGANFGDTTSRGFTYQQLASTASYQAKDLRGIGLAGNDLTGWDLSGQNLANANLCGSTLTNADLSFADMRGAQISLFGLSDEISNNPILSDGTIAGLKLANSGHLVVRNFHDDYQQGLGPITVQDQLTMANGGVLQLRFESDAWDSLISFEPGIPVQLGGTLELTYTDDVDVLTQVSRTIYIFNWTGVAPTGAFTVDSDYLWDLTNLYTSGDVTLVSALTGDTNGDGQVGLNDLNNARNNFGDTGAPGLPGDAIPFDGIVDLGDLNAVRNNFGATQPGSTSVPEPTAWMVALIAVALIAVCRSMKARRSAVAVLVLLALCAPAHGDIYRWDNGEVIPGTEGIELEPGMQLNSYNGEWNSESRNLRFADFSAGLDLSNSSFGFSWLDNARFTNSNVVGANFSGAVLANADLSGANLTGAYLGSSTLTNANFAGAIVKRASFYDTYWRGFTRQQLESTASYQSKDLQGIVLEGLDLTGCDLHGQNLADAQLERTTLTNVDLSGANVKRASLSRTTSRGFTRQQLESTASYQEKDLQGIGLKSNDLTGWDFHEQNLTGASLQVASLTNASYSGAIVNGAFFQEIASHGFTRQQLESTASYQAKDLHGIGLLWSDLTGWDFHEQNLSGASLGHSTLTNVDLSGAIVNGARLEGTTARGFTADQLYSTASYRAKDLHGVGLGANDLTGWDLSGQDLTAASFVWRPDLSIRGLPATLTNANLSLADLRGARVGEANLPDANTRNMIWPVGSIQGLDLAAGEELVVRNSREHTDEFGSPIPFVPITVLRGMALSDGVLQFVFDADDWKSLISFEPGIPVQLGGTLELAFNDDVVATEQAGRALQIFDWTGVEPSGVFTVDSAYLWDLTNLYASGEVTLVSALTSDTNGDGQVDLNDLNNVRNNFGLSGAPGLSGDAIPFDGVVDIRDLNAVRNNFGALQAGSASVPEPSGIAIGAIALLGIAFRFVTRRRAG